MKKHELIASAKMTSKGQITIPKNIRGKLNLKEGDLVVFFEDQEKVIKMTNQNHCEVLPENKEERSVEK